MNGYDIRIAQESSGQIMVWTTMVYTHVLDRSGRGVSGPWDGLKKAVSREGRMTPTWTAGQQRLTTLRCGRIEFQLNRCRAALSVGISFGVDQKQFSARQTQALILFLEAIQRLRMRF
jgi:hypothetical protein